MPRKSTRTRAHRRDRRKAKASKWRRGGRGSMGKVAHGGPGMTQQPVN